VVERRNAPGVQARALTASGAAVDILHAEAVAIKQHSEHCHHYWVLQSTLQSPWLRF
jgi:predicted ATPase